MTASGSRPSTEPPPTRLRVAVVGAGAIGPLHVRAYAADDRVELVGIADVVPERAEALASEYGTTAYPSVELLLAGARPQLVSVATPPGTHLDIAREVLASGLSVIVEKPPVLSLDELDRLEEAERESAGSASVIFQHRFGSGAVRARELLRAGRLGAPRFVLCETSWYRPREYFDPEWRGTWSGEGGGPTLGHGIHQIDLMLHLVGPWRTVDASAFRLDRPVEFEDVAVATVVFENGAVGCVINSLLSPDEVSRIRIDTTDGSLEVTHLYGYADDDWTFTPVSGGVGSAAPAPGAGARRADGESDHGDPWAATRGEDIPSGHGAQLSRLVDDVRANAKHDSTLDSSRATMEFVTALYASAFTGRPVDRADLRPGHRFYDRLDGGTPQELIDEIVTSGRRPHAAP